MSAHIKILIIQLLRLNIDRTRIKYGNRNQKITNVLQINYKRLESKGKQPVEWKSNSHKAIAYTKTLLETLLSHYVLSDLVCLFLCVQVILKS